MKKSVNAVLFFIFTMFIATAYSNCSGFMSDPGVADLSSAYSLERSPLLALSSSDVFIPPNLSNGAVFTSAVETTCSDYGSATLNGNVVRATNYLTIVVTNKATNAQCAYNDTGLRDHLMGEQKLIIPNLKTMCPGFGVGEYSLQLRANGSSANLLAGEADPIAVRMGGAHPYEVTVTQDQYGNYVMAAAASMNGIKPSVLLGANQVGSDITVGSDAHGFDEYCMHRASPLLVQIHPGSSYVNPIEFTPQSRGVKFDILGQKDSPAHSQRNISWFTPATINNNFFIVLPDANGSVTGIDQMFGDNTSGPDGQLAANGYEALRKWDGRRADGSIDTDSRDGIIDARDPVFYKLRLWLDANADGIAQSYELSTLDQYEVVSISLNYDANYGESDKYGNQIKLKSTARTRDGNVHIMYDIWFKYY
jgi:hypothetical protein